MTSQFFELRSVHTGRCKSPNFLFLHAHVIHYQVTQSANTQGESTFVQVDVWGVVGGSFEGVSSWLHATQEHKYAGLFLLEEAKVF